MSNLCKPLQLATKYKQGVCVYIDKLLKQNTGGCSVTDPRKAWSPGVLLGLMSLRQLIVMVFLLGSCQFEQCSDIRFDAILKIMGFSNIGSMRAKMLSVWPETVQKSLLPVTWKVTKWPQMPPIPRSLRWKNCPSATWLCQRRLYGCCLALNFHGYRSRNLFNLQNQDL